MKKHVFLAAAGLWLVCSSGEQAWVARAQQAKTPAPSQTEAIWHCSRSPDTVSQGEADEEGENFQLASMGSKLRALGITLTDLIDVYESKPVLINGRRLNACFMPAEAPLSVKALGALGLNAANMQLQARKSAIVQSHLRLVTDEADMQACIARHHPAVGYLSREIQNERVLPCF
jgi:hypothetical protein